MEGFVTWATDGQGWIALVAIAALVTGLFWRKRK